MRKTITFISLTLLAGLLGLTGWHSVSAQQTTAAQGLEISPPLVEVSTDPGKTETFEIHLRNITDSELIARADINDFTAQGEEGQPAVILDNSEPYPYSLKDWVAEIPELRLAPKEQGTIIITLNVPADASPGGHYGVVRFTALPPDFEDTGVSLSASLGTLILANVSGQTTEKLSVEQFFVSRNDSPGSFFEYGPLNFIARLRNEGTVHLKPTGTIEVKNMLGRKVATLTVNEGQRNVLPDSIRRFDQTVDKKWWFGRYSATLNITYGDGQQVQSTLNFWVVPYKVLAIALTSLILLILLIILLGRRYRRRVMKKAQAETRNNVAEDGSTAGKLIMPEMDGIAKSSESIGKKLISVNSGDTAKGQSKDDTSAG